MPNTINDGQAVPFYIAPVNGVHKELRGTRRPIPRNTLRAIHDQIAVTEDNEQLDALQTQLIKDHVVTWNRGQVTLDAIAALELNEFEKLSQVVIHTRPSDKDPQGKASDANPTQLLEDSQKN